MKTEHKEWIDNADFEQLLRRNRFAPLGDDIFSGETGDYYLKVMSEVKAKLKEGEFVAVSKKIGWEK